MNPSYTAYRMLTACSSWVLVPLIWVHHRLRGKDFGRFHQRMGRYPGPGAIAPPGRPRIWIHAVSVGEVGVAAPIVRAMRSRFAGSAIALSTIREQGLARARELLGDSAACFFAPLDLVGATRKAIQMVQPDILILLETEIWPNLIVSARRLGSRVVLVNGRISSRSIRRYRKLRSLMRFTLSHIDAFSMISAEDAQRIKSLGAPPDRVAVGGNAKFDCPDPLVDPQAREWAGRLYGVGTGSPVFVAGSTRNPEEQFILDAFLKVRSFDPGTLLIIAPRHIERVAQIAQWVTERGLGYQLRTSLDGNQHLRTAPVVILDTIGELQATYSVASMVFCGGSLVPKGGQNIMEPAMWGKPVCYGPSMEDFAEARQVIQAAGGGMTVRNVQEIAATAIQWLQHPSRAVAAGRAARKAILPHRGATQKHSDAICRVLAKSSYGQIVESSNR